MRACFFARVRDPELLDVVEFYRNDIRALEDLGFTVVRATNWREIPWNADLYYTWWWGPGLLTLLKSLPRGRPNVFTGALQLTPHLDWWQTLGTIRRGIVRACVRLATVNAAICEVEQGYLRQLGDPSPRLVYPGIDTDYYRPPTRRPHVSLVLAISHLTADNVARKRLATLIRAVPGIRAMVPDVRVVVAGEHGDGYVLLRDLAVSLGVADVVTFPGRISTEAKLELLQQASVLAQPTVYEGFGVAQAEAMACALPVVTSARGAIPEVVGDCGLFVEPDDSEGLTKAVCRLLADHELAADFGRRGRERVVARFSYQMHRAAMAAVITAAIPGWQAPAHVTSTDASVA